MALPLATAGASDIKFDESYAAATVAQSSSIFEAKPIQISKVFSLKDGTVVTADELAKLERPSSGTQKVIFAKITYDVEFEVTKTYIGSAKIGHQFSLTWSDLHWTMCSPFKARMLNSEGAWSIKTEAQGKKEYKPFPWNAGKLIRETLTKTEQDAGGKRD